MVRLISRIIGNEIGCGKNNVMSCLCCHLSRPLPLHHFLNPASIPGSSAIAASQVSRTYWAASGLDMEKRFFRKHLELLKEQEWKMQSPVKRKKREGKRTDQEKCLCDTWDSFTHSSQMCREIFPGILRRSKGDVKKTVLTLTIQPAAGLQQISAISPESRVYAFLLLL